MALLWALSTSYVHLSCRIDSSGNCVLYIQLAITNHANLWFQVPENKSLNVKTRYKRSKWIFSSYLSEKTQAWASNYVHYWTLLNSWYLPIFWAHSPISLFVHDYYFCHIPLKYRWLVKKNDHTRHTKRKVIYPRFFVVRTRVFTLEFQLETISQ